MSPQHAPRQVTLRESDFTKSEYSPGSEGIVATATVPNGHVWHIPGGTPIECALIVRQSHTVSANASAETVSLDPDAPDVDYLDAFDVYTEESELVVWNEESPGSPTLVTESSSPVSIDSDSYTTSDDHVTGFDVSDSGGSQQEIGIYSVVPTGLVTIQKRTAGKGNLVEEIQTDTAVTHAFQDPHAPDSDRQLRWESMSNRKATLPPKFRLDIVFNDASQAIHITDTFDVDDDGTDEAINPSNLSIRLPVTQRGIRGEESADDLKRQVRADMAGD